MNTEADYSYAEPAPSGPTLHLPFALLSSALALVMISQTVGVFHQKDDLKDGKIQLNDSAAQLSESLAKHTDAVAKREPLVKQTGDLKKKLNDMIMDILILAKTDEDAKAIVGKYNIQQNLPSSGGEAAPTGAPPKQP